MDSPWNQGQLFSTGAGTVKERWATPAHIFEQIAARFGPFDLDAAAESWSAKCGRWFGPDHDDPARRDAFGPGVDWRTGLPEDRVARSFLNPPYGKGIIERWMGAAAWYGANGLWVSTLTFARTDTRWWHEIVMPHAADVLLVKGRIPFVDPVTKKKKAGATAPSAICNFWEPGRDPSGPRFSSISFVGREQWERERESESG